MGRDYYKFSKCCQHFVYGGPDGKLKLWDTSTGTLKQEYIPNLHLDSPCTSLAWFAVPSTVVQAENSRKRKLESKDSTLLCIGSSKGSISLYSLSEGKVVSTLEGGHNGPVSATCWSKTGGLFSTSDKRVIQWDLSKKSIKSKWKTPNRSVILAVNEDGTLCATGNLEIYVWDVEKTQLLKKFPGHSCEIISMEFVSTQHLLTSAVKERHIAAWNVKAPGDDPVGRFALSDYQNGDLSVVEANGTIHLTAATKSGALHYFQHHLNGKIAKSIKPVQTVEIATDAKTGVNHLPIVSARLTSPSIANIAYGYPPLLRFESLNLSEGKENRVCLIRTEPVKPAINKLNKIASEVTDSVEYTVGGSAPKRKANDVTGASATRDVPMEERLGNLSLDYVPSSTTGAPLKQSPYNMSQLLAQGLESKDRQILDSVLTRNESEVINETVLRIPIHMLSPLVQELKHRIVAKSLSAQVGVAWLQAVLRLHASQLLANSSACDVLDSLQGFIESKMSLTSTLSGLSGRLGHLLHMLEAPPSQSLAKFEPVVLYQEDDSSDDGESLMIDTDGNDSDDKWDELDDQLESENASS